MDEFMIRALLGGVGFAAIAGPLGAFMVWRRLAYFGDTLAHASLLGVGLGFWWSIQPLLMVMIICVLVSVLLTLLQRQKSLASDTLLGILSYTALALGVITVALQSDMRVDLLGYLFGDILSIQWQEIAIIYGLSVIIIGMVAYFWRPLLLTTINEDLASVAGISPNRCRLLLMLLLAIIIGLAMNITGVLLITALLIIPAATARIFANTPSQMAILASLIGMCAVIFGLGGAYYFDLPAGPAIVAMAGAMFAVVKMVGMGKS